MNRQQPLVWERCAPASSSNCGSSHARSQSEQEATRQVEAQRQNRARSVPSRTLDAITSLSWRTSRVGDLWRQRIGGLIQAGAVEKQDGVRILLQALSSATNSRFSAWHAPVAFEAV